MSVDNDIFTSQERPIEYIKPKVDSQLEVEKLYSQELIRKKNFYAQESIKMQLDKHNDQSTILFAQDKQRQLADYGKFYGTEKLCRLTRIVLSTPEIMEINTNGETLQDLSEVKEALSYMVEYKMVDGREASRGHIHDAVPLHGFTSIHGQYERPIYRKEYGADGRTAVSYTQTGKRIIYFIPYTKENVDDILQKYPDKHRTFSMSIKHSDSHNEYSVHSEEIFRNETDSNAIIESNKLQFMGVAGKSINNTHTAVSNYRKWSKQKDKVEQQGKRIITVTPEAESLLQEAGTNIEELAKKEIARTRTKKKTSTK